MSTPILTVAPAGTWNLDPVHSRVDFEVRYLAGTFKGQFHESGAELTVDGAGAPLEGTAKVASVDVKDENLSAHLQSRDFFDAARRPALPSAAPDIRRDSHNARLIRAAAEVAGHDVELALFAALKDVPPFDEDDEAHPRPASVARLNETIANADAVLFSTPEYNASIPGQLKNAIDWVSRPVATNVLRNKPVAVVGASTGGFGAVWAQAELRKVLATLGARVLDVELPVPHAHTRFDQAGLTDDGIRTSLAEAVEVLAAEVRNRDGLQVVA